MQLALQNIDKSFGNHIVFQNLSFDLFQLWILSFMWEKWKWKINLIKYFSWDMKISRVVKEL